VTSEGAEFTERSGRHHRELHVHNYRMLGSFEEAENLVQETFLRAWRKRGTFDGSTLFRTWLYRNAANACLDAAAPRLATGPDAAFLRRNAVAAAVPGPLAGRDRARHRATRRGRRLEGDHRWHSSPPCNSCRRSNEPS
jgi:RNA polymerase sigma-70 factor (ECF subfamily)